MYRSESAAFLAAAHRMTRLPHLLSGLAICVGALAQQPVTIRVDATRTSGSFKPIYRFFGYDEPNYTYMKHGRKLVGELAALSEAPAYLRTHFLLATGDGSPGFKWGSTNAYTEDSSGKPVYDWTIVDKIFDTYIQANAKPFVEIGFMPKALSIKPDPYQPHWSPGDRFDQYYIGWSYPPKDYEKWAALVHEWVRHAVEKYGAEEVSTWYWELWNEPDIGYWKGGPEEYNKLYDYTAAALKRALPSAKIGGPATTGPGAERAASFLRQFLEHCANGKNYATGETGSPLDYITYHAKGRPQVVDGHVRMGLSKNLTDVEIGYKIIAAFPKFRKLPIVLSESDPEGCAACSARVYPHNAYRNGPLYAAYTAAAVNGILKLADQHNANIEGMLTWAFEFEDQPYFDGFRTLATNGIDKPVLNVFRMLGLMRGARVAAESSGSAPLAQIVSDGVRDKPDIDALATRSERAVSVLMWNYHDDDVAAPASGIRLTISGLPASEDRVLLRHYRIDNEHSNAYTVWKAMGSPQNPMPEQYAKLERAGQLQMLHSPRWTPAQKGSIDVSFELPRQGVSLIEVSW
jgi:xylan 1,4-beta-xylosidase